MQLDTFSLFFFHSPNLSASYSNQIRFSLNENEHDARRVRVCMCICVERVHDAKKNPKGQNGPDPRRLSLRTHKQTI